jgi:hypothetical protein
VTHSCDLPSCITMEGHAPDAHAAAANAYVPPMPPSQPMEERKPIRGPRRLFPGLSGSEQGRLAPRLQAGGIKMWTKRSALDSCNNVATSGKERWLLKWLRVSFGSQGRGTSKGALNQLMRPSEARTLRHRLPYKR